MWPFVLSRAFVSRAALGVQKNLNLVIAIAEHCGEQPKL